MGIDSTSGSSDRERTVRLHHEEAGAGSPLLLGASLGSTLAMWDANIGALAEHHRVVRFDQRGHGRSPVPPGRYEIADLGRDVLVLMDELGLERASYCGLSLGGMTGMWLAANAPKRIDRLVLLCTSSHLPEGGWAQRAEAVRGAGTTEVIADTVLGRWLTAPFAAARPDLVAALRAMLVSIDSEGYAAACGAIERMDLRQDLARIFAPTLVVAGRRDEATPVEHGREIAERIGGARLEIVPAAHLANVECPDEIARLVLNHLREEP
jgi:3-oxoadipate enol-lactonase